MKRYDKIDDTGSGYSDMREAPAGEWVKYDDVVEIHDVLSAYIMIYGDGSDPLPLGTIKAFDDKERT